MGNKERKGKESGLNGKWREREIVHTMRGNRVRY